MEEKNNIPEILRKICNHLKEENIALNHDSSDGRNNSVKDEKKLLERIEKFLKKFEKNDLEYGPSPKPRFWYDFSIKSIKNKDVFYPVNIKITETTKADNLNCKLGIYYALTGKCPDFSNEIRWSNFFEKLKQNLGTKKDKDYYFLVYSKKNPQDISCRRLRGLSELVSNGNNLPFQCNWSKNKEDIDRSFEEAKDFILESLGESIKQRSEIYDDFKKCFSKYA